MDVLRRIRPGPLVAVLAVALLWSWSDSPSADSFVPELTGLRLEVAKAAAAADGFTTTEVQQTGGGVPGTVVAQSPEPRAILDRGLAITLTVTTGARQVVVPAVAGMPVDRARDTIRQAGLQPGDVVYREDSRVQPDLVITTDPKPRSTVDEGTSVDIIAAL